MNKIRTACTRDCPDACSIIATVEDGRVVQLQGDPDHPITRGFLCHRTSRFLERQYSPDRLTRPLWRKSRSDEFAEISWSDALDLMAEQMCHFRDKSGGASILQYRCGGSLGALKHVGDYFFERFGPVTTKSGDVCAGAGEAAQMLDFGAFDSNDFFDVRNSTTIFLWGKNVATSSVHLIPELKRAKKRGATIVLVDPVHNRTAALADLVVQPRPGGDAALAMGIVRWLHENNRLDAVANEYCDHLDAFYEAAFSKSLDQWAQTADVQTEELIALAAAYANGPSALLIGWGLQRRTYGAATMRALDGLATVSGNMGTAGGGASFYFPRRGAFDFSFANPEAAPRRFPEPILGAEILKAADPPIRMAIVWGANPVAMLPDSTTIAKAMQTREMTVVMDPFMTDTAMCANLVLPTTTMLEESDFVGAYGHHYLAEVRPAVAGLDGVLSDYQILRELSKRVGLAGEFDVDEEVWKLRLLARMRDAGVERDQFEQGYVKNPFADPVLFEGRKFKTESGKVNLICDFPQAMFTPQATDQLLVTAISTIQSQGSQWASADQQGVAQMIIHPDSAKGRRDGDVVELRTAHGAMQVRLKLDCEQRTDIALLDKGGWLHRGRCANSLIAAQLTDDGECAVYYDTPAEICEPASPPGDASGSAERESSAPAT